MTCRGSDILYRKMDTSLRNNRSLSYPKLSTPLNDLGRGANALFRRGR